MTGTAPEKLVTMYDEMGKLTEPECRSSCNAPQSCCSESDCNLAAMWAKREWDTVLEPLPADKRGPKGFPFLSPTGCVVAPHLRPGCTMHTCDMSSFGFKKVDPDGAWTDSYFELRQKITTLEWEWHKAKTAKAEEPSNA